MEQQNHVNTINKPTEKPITNNVQTKVQTTQNLPQNTVKKDVTPVQQKQEGTLTEEEAQKKFLQIVKENTKDDANKSIAEKGREILNITSMSNLLTNEEFVKDYQEVQKKQIIEDLKREGKIDAIKSAAKKQENRNLRNLAFYNAFKPFFENFMGIDESFGLIPMILTVLIFYVPYILISLVLTVVEYAFTGINKIFAAISQFKKPAKALCLTILWIAFTIAIVLGLIYGAQRLFHFKII